MSQTHFPIRPSRIDASTGDSETIASQSRKLPPLMASGATSPSTYLSQSRHSNTKPPVLPPTSVSSFQQVDQLYIPSKTKPPPVPKKRAKSRTANYDHVVRKSGRVSMPTSVSYSVVDFKPTAEHSHAPTVHDGSDDYYQDPDKVHACTG